MNVSDLLNPTDEPKTDGGIRHPGNNVEIDMSSKSFRATVPSPSPSSEDLFPFDAAQEAWLEQVTNDPELYGRLPAFLDRESSMRVNLGQKIARLVRSPIEVLQEMDLRIVPTKRRYRHTETFREYRRQLHSAPTFLGDEFTAVFPPSPTSSLDHTARGTDSVGTDIHSAGPSTIDIGLFIPDAKQTTLNGTLELKKLKRKDVEGTPLDYPPGVGDPLPLILRRELSPATQTYIKQGLARGIWYGAIEQEMMRSNGDPRVPPVLVGYLVNQFFVRILLLEDTIYIERDGDNSSLINLEDYLESFKDGRSFPHHLSTRDGARALMEHVLTACKLLELHELAPQNGFEKCTPPDISHATTQTDRTKSSPVAAAADLSNVTGDDLDKAEHHECPPSPPDRNIVPPSTPASIKPIEPDSPPRTFTQAWIAHCELTGIGPPEEPDLGHSYERTDSVSTTSSFEYTSEEEEVSEHHVKALVSRYKFRCLSRDDFAQTLRRITV